MYASGCLHDQYRGIVGDVARVLGRFLVAPPVDATQIQPYFGDLKRFGAIDDLITMVTKGVPMKAAPSGAGLPHALHYGNHRNVAEHSPPFWEKITQAV